MLALGLAAPGMAKGDETAADADSAIPAAERLRASVLRVHNRTRAAWGTPPLAWDDRLAASAAAFAQTLARAGRLYHSPGPEGENLWMGTRGVFSPDQMQSYWVEEGRLFRRGRFPDIASNGHAKAVGHFSQMIWATTTRVGCALARNAHYDVLVCQYDPAGNREGRDPLDPAPIRLARTRAPATLQEAGTAPAALKASAPAGLPASTPARVTVTPDPALLARAARLTGLASPDAVVHEALNALIAREQPRLARLDSPAPAPPGE